MASTPATSTTKAWAYTKAGLPGQVLRLTTTHPQPPFPPTPPPKKKGNGESPAHQEEHILVRVSYAALNPGEVVVMNFIPAIFRSAAVKALGGASVPAYDLVGTVIDISPPPLPPSSSTVNNANTSLKKGDAVVAFLPLAYKLATGVGALQETVAFPAKYAVRVPENKAPREAAGLLLTACTAVQMVEAAAVKKGDRVLVYGGSGGVGSMLVQVARDVVKGGDGDGDGEVVVVCSGRNGEAVRGMGGDEIIDYTLFSPIEDELARRFGNKPVDAILDGYGNQAVYKSSARYLKPDGIYSAAGVHSTGGFATWPALKAGFAMLGNALWPKSPWLGGTGRTWKAAAMMDPGRELMERVVRMLADGKLRVVVDSEWAFENVQEAYDVLLSGRARGKVIVKVNDGGDDAAH
ncbi:hypothetical protein B0T17DRAFT_624833 [Bombardia bombarda]|uniref:Enoyl reductase (ER) domain-containing protein n=1 Tax=Bombardia bombarda TaxID=252184 RepID=A0AA40CF13_9PEZI|nr:hypothetical protein B0T17DRAFT_624833 [Bombardia bombarda]